ncbi:ABC transporter permease [Leucobacter allii]|uniref:ABC transporter permease n=1 Tax=Leucobacter allii TaxID=2932247 RepID=A0ABY4FKR6_9MICO|nr:ABC transporter permease [Leucobacter allii]UOQ56857.1 ABC transporter permease [Leucobacter allii]
MSVSTSTGTPAGTAGALALRLSRHPVLRYTLRRLGLTLFLALGVTVVTFVLSALVPIDPTVAALGERAAADPEIVAAYRAKYGLDQPLVVQYWVYLTGLLRGDWGMSQQTQRPVLEDLLSYAPATLELVLATIVLAVAVGVLVGLAAALYRNRFPDHAARVIALLGVSTPIFWFGIVMTMIFFAQLGWLPSGGRVDPNLPKLQGGTGFILIDSLLAGQPAIFWSGVQHLILPSIVLGLGTLGLIIRITRASVLEVLGNDYVRAGRAKGLSGGAVVRRYILRSASGSILTVSGVAFGGLLAGTVLIETVFNWPGLGLYAYRSATTGDLNAIMGVTLFVSTAYILVNLVVDLCYMILDPRVRLA